MIITILEEGERMYFERHWPSLLHILITPVVWTTNIQRWTSRYKYHRHLCYITNLYLFTFQNIRSITCELWSFHSHKYYCFPFIATTEIAAILLMERPWPYLLHRLCTLENPITETLHVDSPFSYDVLWLLKASVFNHKFSELYQCNRF